MFNSYIEATFFILWMNKKVVVMAFTKEGIRISGFSHRDFKFCKLYLVCKKKKMSILVS